MVLGCLARNEARESLLLLPDGVKLGLKELVLSSDSIVL